MLDFPDKKMESQKEFNESNHSIVEHLLCMRHCSKCYLILTTFKEENWDTKTNTVSQFSARKGYARYLDSLCDSRRRKPCHPNTLTKE